MEQRIRDHQALARARALLLEAARAAGLGGWDPAGDPELRALPVRARSREALGLRAGVVERNLGLAYSLAHRRARYLRSVGLAVDVEECKQAAAEALTRAVARFNPEKSDSVGAWASVWIAAELKRQTGDVVSGLEAMLVEDLVELAGAHDPRRELARRVDAERLLGMVGEEGRELIGQWAAGPGYSQRAGVTMGGEDRARDRLRRHLDDLRRAVQEDARVAISAGPGCCGAPANSAQLNLFAVSDPG